METKSRYEVISELEAKKRELIQEKNTFPDRIKTKEKNLKDLERTKADNNLVMDRKIEDAKEDLEHYKTQVKTRKETIDLMIESLNESLERFGKLNEKKS